MDKHIKKFLLATENKNCPLCNSKTKKILHREYDKNFKVCLANINYSCSNCHKVVLISSVEKKDFFKIQLFDN